jgi:hemerythrin-like domain-containing protein
LGEIKSLDSDWSEKSIDFAAQLKKFQNQHESILRKTRIFLESMGGNNQTKGRKNSAAIRLNVRYFTRLMKLLDQHQREEERILSPIVDEYLGFDARENMRREHARMLEALRRIGKKLSQVNGSEASRCTIVESAKKFDDIAREQFSREENVTYWFATVCISKTKLQHMKPACTNLTCSGKSLPR